MKKRIIAILFMLLMVMFVCNSIFNLAKVSIGNFTGDKIYANSYLHYILFVIPVLYVLEVCVIVIKRIYIKGSVVLGVLTGLIMILFATGHSRENLLVAIYFICVAVLGFIVSIYIMFEIRPKVEKEMRLLAGVMSGLTYKIKFKLALVLLCVCIACVIYIVCPKKWVCLYVDSHQFLEHSYEVSNDVLIAGDEVVIVNNIGLNDMDYETGWKFHAIKSGNVKVEISSVVQYDHNKFYNDTWDICVDDNLYVHYNVDFEYYLNVYNFYIFIMVISIGLSIIFVVSGIKDKKKE